jgi:hypothetical protein
MSRIVSPVTAAALVCALVPVLSERAAAQSSASAPRMPALARPVANPIVAAPGFRSAVRRGTRTTTGVPGPNYWQQSARYTITARLDVAAKRLEGTTHIGYRNASPDTLRQLVVQLIQNFHRDDSPRGRSAEITGGYTFTRVAAGGTSLSRSQGGQGGPGYRTSATNLYLVPPAPVAPRDSVVLDFEWSFRIPQKGAGERMGWNADDFFYLGYFYPQMAVYDDVVGWEADPFLGTAEFYAGFAEYDVTLDVPEGWLVQGTGRLVNEAEVLPDPVIQRLRQAEASDTVVHVLTEQDLGPGTATRPGSDGRLRWHFAADSVRDVAYSVTRSSLWDVVRTDVGDRNGDGRPEYARAEAIFRPAHGTWRKAARYAQQSIAHHSRYTGVPYPYSHATAVEGSGIIGGGMEFPMMTLIGGVDQGGDTSMYAVTSHELAHNWLPMIVSVDERRYGWMDEGTTSFNEEAAAADFFPGYSGESGQFDGYVGLARQGEEGALIRYSEALDNPGSYGVYAYSKPASLLISLRNLLGTDAFNRAYQGYLRTWAFRHPKPWDFFNYFNASTGQDLDWFWRTWYYETWILDQSVASVTAGRRGTDIVVRDLGDAPMPARLTIVLANGDTLRREIPVATWLGGTRTATVTVPRGQDVARVEIDALLQFPDAMRKNNLWAREADALPASLPPAVRNDMVRMRTPLLARGYRADGDLMSGPAGSRTTQVRTVTLQEGQRYAIQAVCDQDCVDLDLELLSPSGATLAQDVALDDTPHLEFTASAGGSYQLKVVMYSCRVDTCGWAAQVFRR